MTSKYFFHEPTRNSNLIVIVLGKKYYLHKIFLERSPYFMKLINEMKGNELHLRITDHQITLNCKILELIKLLTFISNTNLSSNRLCFLFYL